MDPITIIAAFTAAVDLVKSLAPEIQALLQKGEISVEQQAALRASLDALRTHEAFSGPEWS